VLLLFLPSNQRSRGAVELRIAAARVEHARPSGGGTQVSSPRSERALTVVVKTRRSLKPVEVRAPLAAAEPMLAPLVLPALLRVPSEVAPALPISPLPAPAPAD
jgi:hypothetical protein